MAEKQEGYVAQKRDKEAGHIYFYGDVEHCEWMMKHHRRKLVKATLVVGDERVFTESEVRAMLVNITHECGCYDHRGEPVFATSVDDINHIAAKHGIVLDPA